MKRYIKEMKNDFIEKNINLAKAYPESKEFFADQNKDIERSYRDLEKSLINEFEFIRYIVGYYKREE